MMGVSEPTSELHSDREILPATLLSAGSFPAGQRAAAELQPDRSRKRKTCGRKKQWTRRAEARQRELTPAANWISEQRGGRVANVTRGVRQMFAGSDDPFAGLHPRVFLRCCGHCSA